MAKIALRNVGVEFRLFTGKHQSFRSKIVASATGGQVAQDPAGRVVVNALEHLNINISEGERVGLIGKNGAGKSTLLRVFSRVYRPTTGVAAIEGAVSSLIDISLGINPEATGRQNIFLRGALLGISRREIRNSIDDIVEFSDLGDFIEAPVRTYSSGMQMRLAFSVSTVLAPDILVMDEWLAVGDQEFGVKAQARLQEVVNASKILIIASHSRELLERTCTRGILLDRGRVVRDGPIMEVAEMHFGPKYGDD